MFSNVFPRWENRPRYSPKCQVHRVKNILLSKYMFAYWFFSQFYSMHIYSYRYRFYEMNWQDLKMTRIANQGFATTKMSQYHFKSTSNSWLRKSCIIHPTTSQKSWHALITSFIANNVGSIYSLMGGSQKWSKGVSPIMRYVEWLN